MPHVHEAVLRSVILAANAGELAWIFECAMPALAELGQGTGISAAVKREAILALDEWSARPRLAVCRVEVARFLGIQLETFVRPPLQCFPKWASILNTKSASALAAFISADDFSGTEAYNSFLPTGPSDSAAF